ncbi:MAG: hypothetical protein ABIO72_00880 [Patescibacteria group bacterium]
MAKNSLEGNAARKMPPRPIEQDDEEPITQRMGNAAEETEPITQVRKRPALQEDAEPVTQRMPKRAAAEAKDEDEVQAAKIRRMIDETIEEETSKQSTEEIGDQVTKLVRQGKASGLERDLSKNRKARLEEAEMDARLRRAELAKKWSTKDEAARATQEADENDALKKNRGAEGARGISKEFAATFERSRLASREECDRLLPVGGQRIFDMVQGLLEENMATGALLQVKIDRDTLYESQKYDLAKQYVRIMAKYRKAVESQDKEVRQDTLEQLTRINRTLGIPLNAEVESHLEEEDLGFAREEMKTDERHFVANELRRIVEEGSSTPMDIKTVQEDYKGKGPLVKSAHKIWNQLVKKEKRVPEEDAGLVTEYVFQLARVTKASRDQNSEARRTEDEKLNRMEHVLGITHDKQLDEVIELERLVKNPFEN